MASQKLLVHRRQRTRLLKGKAGTAACLPVCRVNPNAMRAMLRRKTSTSGLHSIHRTRECENSQHQAITSGCVCMLSRCGRYSVQGGAQRRHP